MNAYTYRGWTITGREGNFTAHKGGMFLGYREHIYSMCDWIDKIEPRAA